MISHVFKTYDEKMLIVVMHCDTGESTSKHAHDYPHDCFITKGRVRLDIGSISKELLAGETAHFPDGAEHQITAIEPSIVIVQHDAEKAK